MVKTQWLTAKQQLTGQEDSVTVGASTLKGKWHHDVMEQLKETTLRELGGVKSEVGRDENVRSRGAEMLQNRRVQISV